MKNKHYFAILKKTQERFTLVELVENTPEQWIDLERRDLIKKYSLQSSPKYSLLEFYTYDIENYLPGLLKGDYVKRHYCDEPIIPLQSHTKNYIKEVNRKGCGLTYGKGP